MTILQALDRYYDRMAARGEAEAPGYSREKIGLCVCLAEDGAVTEVIDLHDREGRKAEPRILGVPAAVKRAVNILPNRLWDKTAYSLGRTGGADHRTAREHAAFKTAHRELLADTNDPGLVALARFVETWDPADLDRFPAALRALDTNVVFRLGEERGYIHERDAARSLIVAIGGAGEARAVCLVTGVLAVPARLHPSIKGVWDAQMGGASLVSFNLDAFTSYGKSQGDNAPVSEAVAFRYGAALNAMLAKTSRNRIAWPIGDATVVFWADTTKAVEEHAARVAEDWFLALVDPPPTDGGQAAKIGDALEAVAAGRPIADVTPGVAPATVFHVLGLAPNAARLSVRYWLEGSFEEFAKRLARHHADLRIMPPPSRWGGAPSIRRLLAMTTAFGEKFENIPLLLAGEVTRAVLVGAPYPRTLLAAALIRLRAGDDRGGGWHAAVIKACLNRPIALESERLRREGADPDRIAELERKRLPMALQPERNDEAYQLGRLFAVLEAAQFAALGRVNASIGDRFYAAASSTPARVFGPLLRGLKVHVTDARKRGRGGWIEPRVIDIMARLPRDLPRTLKLDDQGRFAVGYYHERGRFKAESATDENKARGEGDQS